jgi:hypothetical protein
MKSLQCEIEIVKIEVEPLPTDTPATNARRVKKQFCWIVLARHAAGRNCILREYSSPHRLQMLKPTARIPLQLTLFEPIDRHDAFAGGYFE